jgi:Bacterial Ig domain
VKRLAVLLLPAALIACGAPPAPEIVRVEPPKPSIAPLKPTVAPRGIVELTVDTRGNLEPQAVNPNPDSSVTFDLANRVVTTLDVGSNRYISVRFPVTANVAFNNLTLVSYFKEGNNASSAFKNFQSFGGTPTPTDVYSIRPGHGIKLNGTTPEVDVNKADLQVLTTAEASSVTTAARGGGTPIITANEYALEYGFVARRCTANCTTATPTWSRGFAAGQSGEVNITVRVPQAGDVTGYRFSMTFIVANDTLTQYSQSLEDIGTSTVAGIAQANAAITGATSVRVLCNSTYSSGNKAFILGARTAGDGATPLAQYGAQFYRNATAASFSVIPNTQGSFPLGVSPLYTALNGATLTYGGGSSVNGANVGLNQNGSFTFNPVAGSTAADTMNFTVSDNQGCSSVPQTTPVTVSGPIIWYVNGAFGGTSDGRKTNPFKTLATASTTSGNGHTIFVYNGSYTDALTLKLNQNLIGQLEGLAVQGNNVVPTNTPGATIVEAALAGTLNINGLTLNTGAGSSIVRGVNLTNTLTGSSFGTLNLSNVAVNSSGAAVNLSTGVVNASLRSVSSGGGVNGIKLNALTGTGFAVTGTGTTAGSGGTIQSSTGIGVEAVNVSNLDLQYMVVQNTGAHGVIVDTTGSTAASTITIKNNNFRNMAALNAAVFVELFSASNANFDISSNTVGGATAGSAATTDMRGIDVEGCNSTSCNSGTLFQGRVNNNDIRLSTSSTHVSNGIDVDQQFQGTMRVEVKNNVVQNYGTYALDLGALGGNNANLQATVQNNTFSAPTANALQGVRLLAGEGSTIVNALCVNLTGNTITSSVAAVLLRQRINSTFAVQGLTGTPVTNATTVQNFVNGLNTLTAGSLVSPATGINTVNYTSATCQTPSF